MRITEIKTAKTGFINDSYSVDLPLKPEFMNYDTVIEFNYNYLLNNFITVLHIALHITGYVKELACQPSFLVIRNGCINNPSTLYY